MSKKTKGRGHWGADQRACEELIRETAAAALDGQATAVSR